MPGNPDILQWLALAGYGGLLLWLVPRAGTARSFFWAQAPAGGAPSTALLTGSVLVTWIFAKSITNAANLGERFGVLGGLAYAAWYLSIPSAGLLLYSIRRAGHEGLIPFLVARFGTPAAVLFSLTILVRLVNEVWSNTAVVAGYFGAPGSGVYYGAAFAFTLAVLLYSVRGGMHGSILTDRLQLALAVVLLLVVLGLVMPAHGLAELAGTSHFTLAGGVDLLLVALLQVASYPFHDPVLTDRAFVTPPRRMLTAYALAGVLGALFIVLYSLMGVHAKLAGLGGAGDVPMRVARALHTGALGAISLLMMNSAGAVLDSAFSSIARHVSVDLAGEGGAHPSGFRGLLAPLARLAERDGGLRLGRWAMVLFAVVGNLPLFATTDVLKATTLSGTMVLGLTFPFLLWKLHRPAPAAFLLSFLPGLVIGIWSNTSAWPEVLAVGDGAYRSLLGANVYGLLLSGLGYGLGVAWHAGALRRAAPALPLLLLALAPRVLAEPAPEPPPSPSAASEPAPDEGLRLGGETMFRTTLPFEPGSRLGAELYNLRLRMGRSFDGLSFDAEARLRLTKLRSFYTSNLWLQTAELRWRPVPEHAVAAGLLYQRFGLFWDGSWFGNLPYLDGEKLNPDYGLEYVGRPKLGGVRWELVAQFFVKEDGHDGTFFTAAKYAPDGTRPVTLLGEWLERSVSGLEVDVRRSYLTAGARLLLFEVERRWLPTAEVRAVGGRSRYLPEGLEETMFTAAVYARVHRFAGLTLEYVRNQSELGLQFNRVEAILHAYY